MPVISSKTVTITYNGLKLMKNDPRICAELTVHVLLQLGAADAVQHPFIASVVQGKGERLVHINKWYYAFTWHVCLPNTGWYVRW